MNLYDPRKPGAHRAEMDRLHRERRRGLLLIVPLAALVLVLLGALELAGALP